MEQAKILCLGDSNTWGYDPTDPLGQAYPAPWCMQLRELIGKSTVNLGENGKTIPWRPQELDILNRILGKYPDGKQIIVMLGTNDLLRGTAPREAALHMEQLLSFLGENFPHLAPILIAPMQIQLPEFAPLCEGLAALYRGIAQAHHILFADASEWALPMAFDGVHLSEDGHAQFARLVAALL